MVSPLPAPLLRGIPVTALAPMQDVTNLPFMQVISRYGSPDYFFTEYFRVHSQSRLEKHILRSVVEHGNVRPVFAQMIGEAIPDLIRTARELLQYPIAGIDLNMGCPAPKVYKKNCGGGLLRDPEKVDRILGELRNVVPGRLTVKTRIGFENTENFDRVLSLIDKHRIDLLSVHGRTVRESYHSEVHYDFIARAVDTLSCPVLANGNIVSASKARAVVDTTRCFGVMIGRSAIRNPWIFRQCRELWSGNPVFHPTLADVREYIELLFRATFVPEIPERAHVNKMKKYLNFVGQGVDPDGRFLHDIRRTTNRREFFETSDRHLLENGSAAFADEPYNGVIARPNCETPLPSAALAVTR